MALSLIFGAVIIYFERGYIRLFLIFGGKCRLVEREPARCAENKKRGGENVAVFNVIVGFLPYRRWDRRLYGVCCYGPIGEKQRFILGRVAQNKRTIFATLFFIFFKKNLFWSEFIDFSSVF